MGWFKFKSKLQIKEQNVVLFSVSTQLNWKFLQTIKEKWNFQLKIPKKISSIPQVWGWALHSVWVISGLILDS